MFGAQFLSLSHLSMDRLLVRMRCAHTRSRTIEKVPKKRMNKENKWHGKRSEFNILNEEPSERSSRQKQNK